MYLANTRILLGGLLVFESQSLFLRDTAISHSLM